MNEIVNVDEQQLSLKSDNTTVGELWSRAEQAKDWATRNPLKATGLLALGLFSLKSKGVRSGAKWLVSSVATLALKDKLKSVI